MAINHVKESVFPLHRDHVDTDQIIPKQFLKRIESQGFGQFLFYHWRFEDDGKTLREGFSLTPGLQRCRDIDRREEFWMWFIEEHAPLGASGYFGFKVVIAKCFADIFHNNCLKNGILPIDLTIKSLISFGRMSGRLSSMKSRFSLEDQTIKDSEGLQVSFSIDPYWKEYAHQRAG